LAAGERAEVIQRIPGIRKPIFFAPGRNASLLLQGQTEPNLLVPGDEHTTYRTRNNPKRVEVIRLAIDGMKAPEIASRFGLSLFTIRYWLRREVKAGILRRIPKTQPAVWAPGPKVNDFLNTNRLAALPKIPRRKAPPKGTIEYTLYTRGVVRDYEQYYRALVIGKYGGKCVCCNITGLPFLTMDHIDPTTKKSTPKNCYKFYRWLMKNGYPPEFQVLCWNCNVAKARSKKCPHKLDPENQTLPKRIPFE